MRVQSFNITSTNQLKPIQRNSTKFGDWGIALAEVEAERQQATDPKLRLPYVNNQMASLQKLGTGKMVMFKVPRIIGRLEKLDKLFYNTIAYSESGNAQATWPLELPAFDSSIQQWPKNLIRAVLKKYRPETDYGLKKALRAKLSQQSS